MLKTLQLALNRRIRGGFLVLGISVAAFFPFWTTSSYAQINIPQSPSFPPSPQQPSTPDYGPALQPPNANQIMERVNRPRNFEEGDEDIRAELGLASRGLSKTEVHRMYIGKLLQDEERVYTRMEQAPEAALQQQHILFVQALSELTKMADGLAPIDLKRAVYLSENAYLDNHLDYKNFCADIQKAVGICRRIILTHGWSLKDQYACNTAIQIYMDETTNLYNGKTVKPTIHLPMSYDFTDPFGDNDWTQMFVSKLMRTNTGQCHSMPWFYKLVAVELGAEASISFTPNHSFIMFKNEFGVWQNYECTNGRYPSKKSYCNFGYVKQAALANNIFLSPKDLKGHLAHAILDLAEGYDKKFGWDKFTWDCANVAKRLDPLSAGAAMVRFNVKYVDFRQTAARGRAKTLEEALKIPAAYQKFKEMEQMQAELDAIGYERPPDSMYENWRKSIMDEREARDKRLVKTKKQILKK